MVEATTVPEASVERREEVRPVMARLVVVALVVVLFLMTTLVMVEVALLTMMPEVVADTPAEGCAQASYEAVIAPQTMVPFELVVRASEPEH